MHPQVGNLPRGISAEAVLAVSLSKNDHRDLKTISTALHWRLTSAATLAQGLLRAMSQCVAVIVCECNPPDGSWKLLLDKIGVLAQPPRLIVASRLADERLWAEVLNLGGWDVLATPFDAKEVHRVVSYAVDSWRRQVEAGTRRWTSAVS